jgi:hypothetical protein
MGKVVSTVLGIQLGNWATYKFATGDIRLAAAFSVAVILTVVLLGVTGCLKRA